MAVQLRRLLLAPLALLAFAGCQFDYPVEGDIGFRCASDDDCVGGYICRGATDGVGRCADGEVAGTECVDEDNDNAFVGPDCTDQLIDCDDTDPSIRPGGEELCDGVDNNCSCDRASGDTNGDGVVCGPGDDGVDEEIEPLPCPIQSGACAGALAYCVAGEFQDCVSEGLYDERIQAASGRDDVSFEPQEVSCDGFDNDCDGNPDENCECIPGTDTAQECGRSIGACTRGVQLCQDDGAFSACVEARLGTVCDDGTACASSADCGAGTCGPETCATNADCSAGGFCVEEQVDDRESLDDDCLPDSDDDSGCFRSVCRYPEGDVACEDDDACGDDAACVQGACVPEVIRATDELCNGIDDNCDGRIDDDFSRSTICGPCPFNSEFVTIAVTGGRTDFICIDRYEASRADATAGSAGASDLYATSRPGVLPWSGADSEAAEAACSADGLVDAFGGRAIPVAVKRLCKTFEWRQGCGGRDDSVEEIAYPYSVDRASDAFVEGNCVDAFSGAAEPQPTATATNCCRGELCDFVGNVQEYVLGPSNIPQVAGGSFQDDDPSVLTCASPDEFNYYPVPDDIGDVGFRCCTAPAN